MRPEKHQKIRRHQKNKHKQHKHGDQESPSASKQTKTQCERSCPSPRPSPMSACHSHHHSQANKSKHDDETESSESTTIWDREKSFSRRKIESNWSRYGGSDSEDFENEIVTRRGADLSVLLAKEDDFSAQFRFQDEQDWEDETYINQETDVDMLSLNVHKLGQQLQHLSMAQRLNIDQGIVQIFEKEFGIMGKDSSRGCSESTDTQPSSLHAIESSNASSATNVPNPLSEGQSQLHYKQQELLMQSIKSSLHSSQKQAATKTASDSSKAVKLVLSSSNSSKKKVVHECQDEVDEELDFLLSLDNPKQKKESASDKMGADDEHNTDQINCLLNTEQAGLSGEAGLEDWLDSILDE